MSNCVFVGIDNGLDGAISFVSGTEVKYVIPMPVIDGDKRQYDVPTISYILNDNKHDIKMVVLEKAQAMPGQGVTSMFSIGYGFGVMNALLTAHGIPYTVVTPQKWQKEILEKGNGKNTKQASYLACQRMFPGQSFLATPRSRKPHDGMTDATCMAVYAKRMFG